MTIANARKKFEELKATVLEDGKVDIVEAYVLLEFIEPYARAGNKPFEQFNEILRKCTADKQITEDESQELVKAIDKMSKFLKLEAIVECVFFGGLLTVLVVLAVIFIAKSFI